MSHPHTPPLATRTGRLVLALVLLAIAAVVAFFSAGFVSQAFRGPRTITEQDLLAVTQPGSFDNYISYTPPRPAFDTGLVWGKKNNPGTKYLLLPVGDQLMLCSARIANNDSTFVGRLQLVSGGPEEEVVTRLKGSGPGDQARLTPVMLQAVRSIWFDTAAALVFGLGTGLGGLALLVAALRTGTGQQTADRPSREGRRAEEDY